MLANKQMCPLCQNDETIGHISQCTGRRHWQQKFIKNLHSQLQTTKTPEELHHRILNHFSKITTDSAQYSHNKHFTVFTGLLPKAWTTQSPDSFAPDDSQGPRKTYWPVKLGTWLVHQGHELWNVRNNLIHDNNTNPPMQALLDKKI